MQSVAILLVCGVIASVLAAHDRVSRIPKCLCGGLACECCTGFNYNSEEKPVCVKTNYNINSLAMDVELLYDGQTVAAKTIGPNFPPVCAPLPPVPAAKLCLTNNRVDLQRDTTKVCTNLGVRLGVIPVLNMKLPCLALNREGQLMVSRD